MFKKILSHSVVYAIVPQLPKVAGLFLLPIITPFLTEFDFGVWGIVTAFAAIFTAARDLGLVLPLLNSYYKNPLRWRVVWGQVYFFLLVFGVIYALIQGFVISLVLPKEVIFHDKIIILVLILVQTVVLDVPNLLGFRYFQISEKPLIVSVISFLSGTVTVLIQYYCVMHLRLGYMSWFYSVFFGVAVSSLCYVILLFKVNVVPIFRLKRRFLVNNLKVSLPLLPHNYSAYLLNASDRAVMKWYDISANHIGRYNVAYMWGNYMEMLGSAVGMAVGPIYFSLFKDEDIAKKKMLIALNTFLQIAFVFGSFVLALWSKELFAIFIKNEELQNAYLLAAIIIMGYCYRPMYWLVINRLQFFEKTTALWKISLVGGVINVVLNLIFIKIFGYEAAAYTTFVALMYIGFSGYFLKEFKALDSYNYKPFRWLGLICALTIFCYFLQDTNMTVKLMITICSILVIVYFAMKFIKVTQVNG